MTKLLLPFFRNILHVPPSNRSELTEFVATQRTWFHCMDFGDNLVTPGSDPSGKKLYHLCLPERLDGYSVLDVGAFDGFFSFHAAQRGARVVAADKYVWTWPGNTSYENFTTVRRLLTTPVEDIEVAVE